MTLLTIHDLNVSLTVGGGRRLVLRDLNLEMATGETVALVGESGSGKSMTARSIARLLPHQATVSGTIRVDGQDVLNLDEAALRRYRASKIAMIFQDPRVHMNPIRTVGDFLVEGLTTTGGLRRTAAESKMIKLLDDVGISDGRRRLRQYPHELSGGLLQRIMIAAALAGDPRLLLADEPTTALDVSTQSEVMALLDELRRDRGMAMLFITHDLELAAVISDRIAVMYAGEIVEVGTSDRLPRAPRHPYSAGLLGARPDLERVLPRLRAVPGRPLAAFEAPPGCAFSDRCGFAIDRCAHEHPALDLASAAPTRCLRSSEITFTSTPTTATREQLTASSDTVLRVTGLSKDFHGHRAVDDVSFSLVSGGSIGIVGESGSGKTTVARMLVGLTAPAAGTIEVCGRDRSKPAVRLAERRERARELQIVFQDPYSTLDPRQSAQTCLDEVLRLHRPELDRGARAARIRELAGMVGIDERQQRAFPRRLSGGQRQRISIARALAVEPQVLILDESVSALDVSIQAQILNLLDDIRRATGVSYVLISHDLAVVRQLTETCVVMRQGRIVESGLTGDVLDRPQHPYTKALRASVPAPGWKPTRRPTSMSM
ncbi:ABC transporter ATP-binding protein [Streptosporangium sp. NPDC051023]|uniref:ABC transporter ATP-binding protein n=1 Tax=Streptosporangium sp. NPDC051023 TaxID=3155410 RepID=UPI00344D8808